MLTSFEAKSITHWHVDGITRSKGLSFVYSSLESSKHIRRAKRSKKFANGLST